MQLNALALFAGRLARNHHGYVAVHRPGRDTEDGGDLLKVEAAVLDGTGKLELTGKLGDVMKESAEAALSFVRQVAPEYGIGTDF